MSKQGYPIGRRVTVFLAEVPPASTCVMAGCKSQSLRRRASSTTYVQYKSSRDKVRWQDGGRQKRLLYHWLITRLPVVA